MPRKIHDYKTHYTPNENGCWIWNGCFTNGYGVISRTKTGTTRAHRYFYEQFIGPIPKGLVLDHLCRNRSCVNPLHLEAVTSYVNTMRSEIGVCQLNARKTTCPRGHEYDYLYKNSDGGIGRWCTICQKEREKRRAKVKQAKRNNTDQDNENRLGNRS